MSFILGFIVQDLINYWVKRILKTPTLKLEQELALQVIIFALLFFFVVSL